MRAIVVHSPLVGPSTVRPLAAALDALGVAANVPDLRAAATSAGAFQLGVTAAAAGADVIVGHSGAGAFLPAAADAAGVRTMVFVDALVPADAGPYAPSGPFLELLDTLPIADGLLPPWTEWWPAGTMASLVPDEAQRRRIEAEVPRVPRSFFDEEVATPPRWWTHPAAYLQLSPAYDDDRSRATGWRWPTASVAGHHLDVCTTPHVVARGVRDLIDRLDVPPSGPVSP